jgi:Flp pilus assembly protein TadD
MLARQGKFSEATSQLSEALRLEPGNAEAHNNLGLVLLMAGQPEKSLPHFSAALRLKPNFAAASENLKRAQRQIDARPK